jgi:hypothetical protein
MDEANKLVIPDSISWSLYSDPGSVVNNRLNVPISVPASSVMIVLSGDDLATSKYDAVFELHLIVESTYTSSAGQGLDLVDSCIIPVKKVSGGVLID